MRLIYLHAKVSYEPKYQLLIKKTEAIGQKQVKNISKIQKFSLNIQMIWNLLISNIDECNPEKT